MTDDDGKRQRRQQKREVNRLSRLFSNRTERFSAQERFTTEIAPRPRGADCVLSQSNGFITAESRAFVIADKERDAYQRLIRRFFRTKNISQQTVTRYAELPDRSRRVIRATNPVSDDNKYKQPIRAVG